MIDDNTSLAMYDNKGDKTLYIVRRDLAKGYEIEVEASEAPILNKMLSDPDPYESSMAELKILEKEVFPVNDSIKHVFNVDLDLYSVKLAIGGSKTDYVTIEERDLIKYNVAPTLEGLKDFYAENIDSILGFLDCEYIAEEGNVIYLDCGKKNISNNITSIKLKILSSMQQRGFFLQQEHKYYGLQLYIIIESKVSDDDKLFEFLKELEIDWELIFFRRNLAIIDWTGIECDRNADNLKKYLQSKYDNLNYFDINNITRIIVNNKLAFKVADRMATLLSTMKEERVLQYQNDFQRQYQEERDRKYILEEERARILNQINKLRRKQQMNPTDELDNQLNDLRNQKNDIERDQRKLLENFTRLQEKIQNPDDAYSISLKKAEIAAAAKLACAYLGIHQEFNFDRDIPISEILKYEEELSNM